MVGEEGQWDDREYLPGKTQGDGALAEALLRRWRAVEADVEAARPEFDALRASGALAHAAWSSDIVVPRPYWTRGASIERTEFRAIELSQVVLLASLVHHVFQAKSYQNRRGERITWETVDMHAINSHIVMPLTQRFACSFVELVAGGEQRPKWFVSHWWGTPFQDTVALLTWHARCRGLATSSAYWICTFANNQHELGELTGDLLDTPFVRAIRGPGCVGTLAIFDRKATTFSRVWCVLEGHLSMMEVKRMKPGFRYDLAGMLTNSTGAGLRMDTGDGDAEECCEGDGVLPGLIPLAAVGLRVEMADASHEMDRRRILHHIVGTPERLRTQEPPLNHSRYDELNRFMRQGFAGQALMRSVKDADLGAMRLILGEFPEAAHFVSKYGGSVVDAARRPGMDPRALALLEEALASGPPSVSTAGRVADGDGGADAVGKATFPEGAQNHMRSAALRGSRTCARSSPADLIGRDMGVAS